MGWEQAFHWPSLPESLDRSLFGVVAMGRIVGDGVMYFYIQDVAVAPSHQRLGIGQHILDALLEHIQDRALAFVGLFATGEGREWYERNGFSPGDMTGMFRVEN